MEQNDPTLAPFWAQCLLVHADSRGILRDDCTMGELCGDGGCVYFEPGENGHCITCECHETKHKAQFNHKKAQSGLMMRVCLRCHQNAKQLWTECRIEVYNKHDLNPEEDQLSLDQLNVLWDVVKKRLPSCPHFVDLVE